MRKRLANIYTAAMCIIATVLGWRAWIVATRRPDALPNAMLAAEEARQAAPTLNDNLVRAAASTGSWIGPHNAPVVVLVFTDLYCGHCAAFEPALEELRSRYPQHIAIVIKGFWPEQTRPSLMAFLGAFCAADQGRLETYMDHFFQAELQPGAPLPTWAAAVREVNGIDTSRYTSCVESESHRARLVRDTREALALGVTGTPTTFLNGIRLVGSVRFAVLDSIVAVLLDRQPSAG